jgi:hypothetical protein
VPRARRVGVGSDVGTGGSNEGVGVDSNGDLESPSVVVLVGVGGSSRGDSSTVAISGGSEIISMGGERLLSE